MNLVDARVLFSKMKVAELLDPALKGKKSALERHHVFPRNYLKQLGITDIRDTNQIANFALIEWADNIDISDSPPAEYYQRYLEERPLTEDDLRLMSYWHALLKNWTAMEYSEFLRERQQLIARVIRDGFQALSGQVLA